MERGDGIAKTENILGSVPAETAAEKSRKAHTVARTASGRVSAPLPQGTLQMRLCLQHEKAHVLISY